MKNHPTPANFPRWFDPRRNQPGYWGFILNRITAIGLTVYLFLHLAALGQLASGPQQYDTFIGLVSSPWFKLGELLVIAAGAIHGLNGIRIALTSFGFGVRIQKPTFIVLMALSAGIILFFAYRMFLVD